ncbi:hypothetical protein GCM10023149_43110 [Mucilaginibacter gynuensis]|uniref:Uncharacterized protein n=1 Tax=Mucilaginibacter gynuensis TaxID=1302236 RepID=A0ABP8H6U9_9SPHI
MRLQLVQRKLAKLKGRCQSIQVYSPPRLPELPNKAAGINPSNPVADGVSSLYLILYYTFVFAVFGISKPKLPADKAAGTKENPDG